MQLRSALIKTLMDDPQTTTEAPTALASITPPWLRKLGTIFFTTLWIGAYISAVRLVHRFFEIAREFAALSPSDSVFDNENHAHLYRLITYTWFERYAWYPSMVLVGLICTRHLIMREPSRLTWVLFAATLLLLGLAAWTILTFSGQQHSGVISA